MDTRQMESDLAKKYKYAPLSEFKSKTMRRFYKDNVPDFLDINGDYEKVLYTLKGTPFLKGYERIVVGDYGAFIEFNESHLTCGLEVAPGQEYRINDPKYSRNVKYEWWTVNDLSSIKIYKQKRKVSYADYMPGKFYVSVHEVDED